MKIYTKTGDDGTTALFDGTRVGKDDERVIVYGDIDELNAFIGLATSFLMDEALKNELYGIQKNLFALGAKLANPKERKQKAKADFDEDKITSLEQSIDHMESSLRPMTNFILPGGSSASAALHVARTVCRRAERLMVILSRKDPLDSTYIKFINRLSDYLFVAARYANHLEKREDVPW
jgi:cob(I)alamin adenosyltransferase